MFAGILDATIISELIVHVVLVSGCVVLAMLHMFWVSRSAVVESVKSVSKVQSQIELSSVASFIRL